MTPESTTSTTLTRYAWLAIAAAAVTIALKSWAYWVTGSVGLLSDALESVVNLVAATVALFVLWIAAKEPDDEHAYGHAKAEYFSSGLEGMLILVAAFGIVWSSIDRLLHPQEIEQVGLGLGISVVASIVNGLVAIQLLRASREHRSITLEASGRHLLTDVWTSAGVVLAVALVVLTGWDPLDPIVALIVAANIIWTGWRLMDTSIHGLLDTALPQEDRDVIEATLGRYRDSLGIQTHALRTREAGTRRFMSVHVLVPGGWSVHKGHQLLEEIERDVQAQLPGLSVFTHLESLDDPASWADVELDRTDPAEHATLPLQDIQSREP